MDKQSAVHNTLASRCYIHHFNLSLTHTDATRVTNSWLTSYTTIHQNTRESTAGGIIWSSWSLAVPAVMRLAINTCAKIYLLPE